MTALPLIEGIRLAEESEDGLVLAVGPEAGTPQFMRLLFWLPGGHELEFLDQYFPSPTDPGGYVDIQRKGDWFLYRVGNHGWTTGWLSQSPQLLSAMMVLNLDPEPSCPAPLTRIRVKRGALVHSAFEGR